MNQKLDRRLKLTLSQLEVFAAVARGGSTRAAAEDISRSQSAASNALGELEAALGVRLFDRVGRKLIINENGQALLPHAVSVLEEAVKAETLFRSPHATPLRLASSYTVGEYLLPERIAQWKAQHPGSSVLIQILNTQDVVEAVASFQADVGFIEGPLTHPALKVRHWRSDQLVIVAAKGHPVPRRKLSPRQLAKASWVLREPGSGTREASDRWLIPHLPDMQVELELGSNEAVKRAVAAGIGLGCLSRLAVHEAIEQGWLVELPTALPEMKRALSIVLHRGRKLGAGAQSFLDDCLASADPR